MAVEDADLPWAVTNGISGAVRRGVLLRGCAAVAVAEDGRSEVSTATPQERSSVSLLPSWSGCWVNPGIRGENYT